MKLMMLSFSLVFFLGGIQAQTSKLVAGTKWQVTKTQKLTNSSNMMGTDFTTTINTKGNIEIEVKSVHDSTVLLSTKVIRITGSANMMGQENNFDSDDSSTMNNPMAASLLKDLGKPEEFTVVNGRIKDHSAGAENVSLGALSINPEEIIDELFVPADAKNRQEGFKWAADNKSDDGSQKAVSIFTLTKTINDILEVTANTTLSSKGTSKMMGMDVSQNLTGTRTSVMSYNKLSSILTSATQAIDLKGTAEVMGNNLPLNTSGTATITVQ